MLVFIMFCNYLNKVITDPSTEFPYMLSGNYILVLYQCRYLALQLSGNIWPAELVGHLTHPVLLERHPFYLGIILIVIPLPRPNAFRITFVIFLVPGFDCSS